MLWQVCDQRTSTKKPKQQFKRSLKGVIKSKSSPWLVRFFSPNTIK